MAETTDETRTRKDRPGGERRQPRRAEERGAELLGAKLYRAAGLLLLIAIAVFFLRPILNAFLIGFVAVILAIAFNAAVERIPLSRGISTAIVAVATLLALAALAWFALTYLVDQLQDLLADAPALYASIDEWEAWLEARFNLDLGPVAAQLRGWVEGFLAQIDAAWVFARLFSILHFVALTFLVLIGAFFAVGRPNDGLLIPVLRTVPPERRPAFRRIFSLLGSRISAWIWGTIIASVAVGVMSVLVFWALGTPYPLLLGTLVGLTNVVPLVGPWIGGAVAVVVTLVFDPGTAVWVALAVLIIQEIESNLIRPFVMSGVAKVHPFPTLIALVVFTSMFGILGAILSLPLLIVIATVVQVLWVEESLGDRDDVEPVVTD